MSRPRSSPWRGAGEGSVLMRALCVCGVVLLSLAIPSAAGAQQPWSDPSLSPDRRADLVVDAMTLPEKAELMSNDTGTSWAYFNAGIERLGIPSLRMLDAGSGLRLGGVTLPETGEPGDRDAVARMLLGGRLRPGARRALRPHRGGRGARRSAATCCSARTATSSARPGGGAPTRPRARTRCSPARVVGPYVRAVKDRGVIANLKHYNLYTQETQPQRRPTTRARTSARSRRSTRRRGRRRCDNGLGSTMCSFNKLNGDYACENRLLLVDILKRQLGFDGLRADGLRRRPLHRAVAQQRPRHGDRQPPVLHAGDHPRRGRSPAR